MFCEFASTYAWFDMRYVLAPCVVGDSLYSELYLWKVTKMVNSSPEFMKICTYQTIEVNMRGCTCVNVPFEAGTLNVKLHFHQQKLFVQFVNIHSRDMPVHAGAANQRGHERYDRSHHPIVKQAGSQVLKTSISLLAKGVFARKNLKRKSSGRWK